MRYLKEHGIKVAYKRSDTNTIKVSLFQYLKRPQVKIEDLNLRLPFKATRDILKGIEIEAKYSGFIKRELSEVRSFKHLEKVKIPEKFDYQTLSTLSGEIREKLSALRPATLGQANRISGMTPAAITALLVHLKKRSACEQRS